MIRYGIAQFTGSWVSASGSRLAIRKVTNSRALVDLLDATGSPVRRPYMNNAPSVHMVARSTDYDGTLEVQLWKQGSGYVLYLTHEDNYELDEQRRESLVPGISRYEEDQFLDQYGKLFGTLQHFVRSKHRTRRPPKLRLAGQHEVGGSERQL